MKLWSFHFFFYWYSIFQSFELNMWRLGLHLADHHFKPHGVNEGERWWSVFIIWPFNFAHQHNRQPERAFWRLFWTLKNPLSKRQKPSQRLTKSFASEGKSHRLGALASSQKPVFQFLFWVSSPVVTCFATRLSSHSCRVREIDFIIFAHYQRFKIKKKKIQDADSEFQFDISNCFGAYFYQNVANNDWYWKLYKREQHPFSRVYSKNITRLLRYSIQGKRLCIRIRWTNNNDYQCTTGNLETSLPAVVDVAFTIISFDEPRFPGVLSHAGAYRSLAQ